MSENIRLLTQPLAEPRIGDYLTEHLRDPRWKRFRAAVAFVRQSGVRHIRDPLLAMLDRGGKVQFSVGVDLWGTSLEGLTDLLEVVEDRGEIWIFHNSAHVTFHPKVYAFDDEDVTDVLVGSGNLTEGGLYTNYEAALAATLLRGRDDRAIVSLNATLEAWMSPTERLARRLDRDVLHLLTDAGLVRPEAHTSDGDYGEVDVTGSLVRELGMFASVAVRPAPVVGRDRPTAGTRGAQLKAPLARSARREVRGFVMTLGVTDAGSGQRTPGASRRSPEVFIPLAARDANPDFWGFPDLFQEDPSKPGKFDRRNVRVRIGNRVATVNMMTWPDKHDFRLRSEALRSAGDVGDILRIEKVDGRPYDYYAEAIPQGTADFDRYDAICTQPVRNSSKRWGYY